MLVSTPALKSSTFVYYGMWYKNCRDDLDCPDYMRSVVSFHRQQDGQPCPDIGDK